MKKLMILILSFLMMCFYAVTHGLEILSAPSLSSSSSTSLTLEWEEIPDAIGYYLYYDTTTGETAGYKNEWVDLIDGTQYTLEGLQVATEYFVALTAVDLAWEESFYSPEGVFTTGWGSTQAAFALDKVEATAIDSLTLSFSADLDDSDDAERDFLIINSITGEEVFVTATDLDTQDASQLTVILDRDLITWDKYDFTILSIIDANGRNIESGIDALTSFEVPLVFETEEIVDLNSAGTQEPVDTPDPVTSEPEPVEQTPVEQNISETSNSTPVIGWANSGQMISNSELGKHTEVMAEKSDKLPQTGPEHILLMILALALGLGLLSYKVKMRKS